MAKTKTNGVVKVAAALIATATPQTEVVQPQPEPIKQVEYFGNKWEKTHAIAYYKAGKLDYLSKINPTGNLIDDFGSFMFCQGAGKSKDLQDSICWKRDKNGDWVINPDGSNVIDWSAFPPKADKDGFKYHTSDDVTWRLFSSPVLAKAVGYKPTPEGFYDMDENVRKGIIKYHLDMGSITTSEVVNAVIAYCLWGSGHYIYMVKRFNEKYGDLNAFIKLKGEYFVFYELLLCRQETLFERNRHSWPVMGRGWSSGLAHFHRVFKTYCHD